MSKQTTTKVATKMLVFTIKWHKQNKTKNLAIQNKLHTAMDYLSLQNCLLLYKTLAVLQPVDHIFINLVVKILAKKRRNYFKI